MSKNSLCDHCKKPMDDHTKNELISCKLENAKNDESELTDEEVTKYFNEIKSGEFSRMGESHEAPK